MATQFDDSIVKLAVYELDKFKLKNELIINCEDWPNELCIDIYSWQDLKRSHL